LSYESWPAACLGDEGERQSLKPLPCPFCGSQPELFPKNPKRDGNAWGEVRCVNEECPAQPKVSDGELLADDRGTALYQSAAVARWNQRWE
jgi:hypothetical protein